MIFQAGKQLRVLFIGGVASYQQGKGLTGPETGSNKEVKP